MKRKSSQNNYLDVRRFTILICLAFFIAGTVAGAFYFLYCSKHGVSPLTITSASASWKSAFSSAFILKIKLLLVISILSFTLFGSVVIPVVDSAFGFVLSASFCSVIKAVGESGTVAKTFSFLPLAFIFIPIFIVLSAEAVDLSSKFCGFSVNPYRDSGIYQRVLFIILMLAAAAVFSAFSSFIEAILWTVR
ncbi:MAG: hypothetical protein Q8865_06075 [Bacillota bacterium]|nr:hypothetical protein [Bacillota bacterium]